MEILSTRPQNLTLEARHTISLEVAKQRRLRVPSSLFIPKIFTKSGHPTTQEDNMNSQPSGHLHGVHMSSRVESGENSTTNDVTKNASYADAKQNMSFTTAYNTIKPTDPRLQVLRNQLNQSNKYTSQLYARYTSTRTQAPPQPQTMNDPTNDAPKPPAVSVVNIPQIICSLPITSFQQHDRYSNQLEAQGTTTQNQEPPTRPVGAFSMFSNAANAAPVSVVNEPQIRCSRSSTSSDQENRFSSQQTARDTPTQIKEPPICPISPVTQIKDDNNSYEPEPPDAHESHSIEEPINYTNHQSAWQRSTPSQERSIASPVSQVAVTNIAPSPRASQVSVATEPYPTEQPNNYRNQQAAWQRSTPPQERPNASPVTRVAVTNIAPSPRAPHVSVMNEPYPTEQPNNYRNQQQGAWQGTNQPQERPNASPVSRVAVTNVASSPRASQASLVNEPYLTEEPNNYRNQQQAAWQRTNQPQERPNASPVGRVAVTNVASSPRASQASLVNEPYPTEEPNNYRNQQQAAWQRTNQPQERPNPSPVSRVAVSNVASSPRASQASLVNEPYPTEEPNNYRNQQQAAWQRTNQPQERSNASPIGRAAVTNVIHNPRVSQASVANKPYPTEQPNNYRNQQQAAWQRSTQPQERPNIYTKPSHRNETRAPSPPDYIGPNEETIPFGHFGRRNQPSPSGYRQETRTTPLNNPCEDISNNDNLPPKNLQRTPTQTVRQTARSEQNQQEESQKPKTNDQTNCQQPHHPREPTMPVYPPPHVFVFCPPPASYQPVIYTDEPYQNQRHPSMSMPNFMAPEIRYRPYQYVPRPQSMCHAPSLPMLELQPTQNESTPAPALPASLAPADMAKWLSSRYQQAVPQPQQDYVSIERQLADYQQALVRYSTPQQNTLNFMKSFCDQYADAVQSQRFSDNSVNQSNNFSDNRPTNYGLPKMRNPGNQWPNSMNQKSMGKNSGQPNNFMPHQGHFSDAINMPTSMPMRRMGFMGPSPTLPNYHSRPLQYGPPIQFPMPNFPTNISPAMGELSLNEQIPEEFYRTMMNISEYDPRDNH